MDGWNDDMPWLGQYVLDERGNPMPAPGLLAWGAWLEKPERRRVALTEFAWGRVSTVFLGLDHSFDPDPLRDPLNYEPVLWETMVFVDAGAMESAAARAAARAGLDGLDGFDGLVVIGPNGLAALDQSCRRYTSREQALAGHREAVEECKRACAEHPVDTIAWENRDQSSEIRDQGQSPGSVTDH